MNDAALCCFSLCTLALSSLQVIADPVTLYKVVGDDCFEVTIGQKENTRLVQSAADTGLSEGACSNHGFTTEVPGGGMALRIPFVNEQLTYTRMQRSALDVVKLKAQQFFAVPIPFFSSLRFSGIPNLRTPTSQPSTKRFFKEESANLLNVAYVERKENTISDAEQQKHAIHEEAPGRSRSESGGSNSGALDGDWTCTATWGMKEFLEVNNVTGIKQNALVAAPWPSWHFQQNGDRILFHNKVIALPTLEENIRTDREPFTIVDAWKQTVECRAFWEGDMLVVEKDNPQGRTREERRVDESGNLQFVLTAITDDGQKKGPSWGRTFERKKEWGWR